MKHHDVTFYTSNDSTIGAKITDKWGLSLYVCGADAQKCDKMNAMYWVLCRLRRYRQGNLDV